jgi:murein DD-endopeptidase MepM/ murein hydrolase activator NlpD
LGIAFIASSLILIFNFLDRADVDSSPKPTKFVPIGKKYEGAPLLLSPPFSPIQPIEGFVNRGDSLSNLLGEYQVGSKEIFELVLSGNDLYDLNRMKRGNRYSFVIDFEQEELIRFEYAIDEEKILIAERNGEGFISRIEKIHYETKTKHVPGKIESSLFEAADEVGLSPQITLSLVDVFSWDIDFNVDIREGDTFSVIFEEKYLANEFAHFGKIIAALMTVQGQAYYGLYYKGANGRSDYYDLNGNSLRKVFLKSPLRYNRISSSFSRRRLHPILKIYRPHLGIDYAAPRGTPVQAIGDGKIMYAGWRGGYGKFVQIKHNSSYQSTYGHLSRYGRNIKKNRMVTQGQVIGFVGSTGLSTGPHLDFRLLYKGRFVNPLKINFPSANPVDPKELPVFKAKIKSMLSALNKGEGKIMSKTVQFKDSRPSN